jgi:hypothetical protein
MVDISAMTPPFQDPFSDGREEEVLSTFLPNLGPLPINKRD